MRLLWLLLAVLLCVGGAYSYLTKKPHGASSRVRPERGGDFFLHGPTGPWSLSKDGHGFVTLLYFGFTHCPGICPMALLKIHNELGKLETPLLDRVKVVFISVDYRADSPQATDKFAKAIDSKFLGVTGSRAELDQVTEKYGAAYRLKEKAPGSTDYSVDHSNQIFVINPEGQLEEWLAAGYEDSRLATKILEILTRSGKQP